MSVDVERRTPGAGAGAPSAPARRAGWALPVSVAGLAVGVALTRLPFLGSAPSPDEGGFLVVGGQWAPGSSLYGSYWVDRPPLLIGLFAGSEALGGLVALRLLGVLAVALAVAAAAMLGWHASGRSRTGAFVTALTCATFLATPSFGTRIVDGELLASPIVLGGLAALLASYGTARRLRGTQRARVMVLRVLAGALGAAAFLVKQDMVDVFVVVAVLAVHATWRRGLRAASADLVPVLAGAVATASAVAIWASARGTSPAGLWGAVIAFRFAAAGIVGFSGPRLLGLVHAYVVTGALGLTAITAAACLASRRRPQRIDRRSVPWCSAALALTGWELVAVLAGGSYWSHYLVGLVPGTTFLVAVSTRSPGRLARGALTIALAYAVAATTVSLSLHPTPARTPTDDQMAASYLRQNGRPGDSVVVAFGHADIVEESGLGSPYPFLWALPAFVEDPHLAALDHLLASPAAPRWLVTGGDLSQWGPPGATAQRAVDRRYSVAFRTGRWIVLRRDGPTG